MQHPVVHESPPKHVFGPSLEKGAGLGLLHELLVDPLPLLKSLRVSPALGVVAGVVGEGADPLLAKRAEKLLVVVLALDFL